MSAAEVDVTHLQAQLANTEHQRQEALDGWEESRDQVEGFQREVQRLRLQLEQARKDLEVAKKERDQAIEHDVDVSRVLGRTMRVLDDAGIPAANEQPYGIATIRSLHVNERVALVVEKLRATSGALDQVESERAEAVLKAMAAEDSARRVDERCKRLEWWALQLVSRTPWRFVS